MLATNILSYATNIEASALAQARAFSRHRSPELFNPATGFATQEFLHHPTELNPISHRLERHRLGIKVARVPQARMYEFQKR